MRFLPPTQTEFTLTLALTDWKKSELPVSLGKATVLLGDKRLEPKSLDENRELIFPNISSNYLDSLVTLHFEGSYKVDLPRKYPRQGKRMEFKLISKGTTIRGRVYLPGGAGPIPAEGAILGVGGDAQRDTTDSQGNFSLHILETEGEKVRFRIMYQNLERKDKLFVVQGIPYEYDILLDEN